MVASSHTDTRLVCNDGQLLHNRLTVWLLLPALRHCPAFLQEDECFVVLLPDFSVSEVRNGSKIMTCIWSQVTTSISRILGSLREEEKVSDELKQNNTDLNNQAGTVLCQTKIDQNIPKLNNKVLSPDKTELVSFCDTLLDNEENLFISDRPDDSEPASQPDEAEVASKDVVKLDEKKQQRKKNDTLIGPRTVKKSYEGEILPGSHPYKCTFCDKRFKQVGHANLHERTHTGDKKYVCSYCQKKFNQLSHLKDHERIHTGEKPFVCDMCGKCFGYNSALKSHKKIHTGEKTYKCGFCEKSFNQLGNLRTHERLHTGELKFMCSECGKCYNTRSNLGRHACNRSLQTSGGIGYVF